MKRLATTLLIGTTLLLCAVIAPGRGDDQELAKRHVKSIEVWNVPQRGGKNVALGIAVNQSPGLTLPRGITALINDRQVHLYDDGRWPDPSAGDGVYTVAGSTRDGQPLKDKSTLRLQSSALVESIAAPLVSCTLSVVECPSNCSSFLFHRPCVICMKLDSCTIEF